MPRGIKKENLPSKICVSCKRPFTWRKKWERCWDEVTTCSNRCNYERKASKKSDPADGGEGEEEVISASLDDGGGQFEGGSASADVPSNPRKEARKQAKKLVKEQKRLQRQGEAPADYGQKKCESCGTKVDLLIRCRTDATEVWRMVCGRCWKRVSGGVVDGDAAHPYYKYGGLWKNRHVKEDTGYGKSRAGRKQNRGEEEEEDDFVAAFEGLEVMDSPIPRDGFVDDEQKSESASGGHSGSDAIADDQ